MPDDHSKVVPLLPIPNRKVKRLSADDSADSRVKVGHRQASILEKPSVKTEGFLFLTFSCDLGLRFGVLIYKIFSLRKNFINNSKESNSDV